MSSEYILWLPITIFMGLLNVWMSGSLILLAGHRLFSFCLFWLMWLCKLLFYLMLLCYNLLLSLRSLVYFLMRDIKEEDLDGWWDGKKREKEREGTLYLWCLMWEKTFVFNPFDVFCQVIILFNNAVQKKCIKLHKIAYLFIWFEISMR